MPTTLLSISHLSENKEDTLSCTSVLNDKGLRDTFPKCTALECILFIIHKKLCNTRNKAKLLLFVRGLLI